MYSFSLSSSLHWLCSVKSFSTRLMNEHVLSWKCPSTLVSSQVDTRQRSLNQVWGARGLCSRLTVTVGTSHIPGHLDFTLPIAKLVILFIGAWRFQMSGQGAYQKISGGKSLQASSGRKRHRQLLLLSSGSSRRLTLAMGLGAQLLPERLHWGGCVHWTRSSCQLHSSRAV